MRDVGLDGIQNDADDQILDRPQGADRRVVHLAQRSSTDDLEQVGAQTGQDRADHHPLRAAGTQPSGHCAECAEGSGVHASFCRHARRTDP